MGEVVLTCVLQALLMEEAMLAFFSSMLMVTLF